MATLSASKARTNLYRLIDDASSSHEAILITGKRTNAVLVSEDDWKAIQEHAYRISSERFGLNGGERAAVHAGS